MTFNIGVNVIEVDGAASPTIVGASVSVAAFNILTQRGVANQPVRVTTYNQFVERFGSYFQGGLGAYMVKGFFDNQGQRAYINRVVAGSATPASLTLQGGADVMTLEAGFRGQEDPGTWGNELFVRVQASSSANSRLHENTPAIIIGTALTPPVDMSALPALTVRVDGEATPTEISFAAGDFSNAATATLEEIRDAINRRTSKLIASLDGNAIRLTSTGEVATSRNDWTSLQVTANNATLGFSVMATPQMATPAALAAGNARFARINDFQVGDRIRILNVDAAGATTASHNAKILRIISATNTIEWTPAIADLAPYNALRTRIENSEFDLTVTWGGTEDENIVETWAGLSMEPDITNYAVAVLNSSLNGSRYLVATDENPVATPRNVPGALAFTQLTPGSDGTATALDFIGDPAQRTGFSAFDPFDVQLLCTERTDSAIVRAGIDYCTLRGDCTFVGAVPEGYVAGGQAITYGQALQGKKVYGVLYGPWIKVFDPIAPGEEKVKWLPPTGHILGVYARIATTRGIWKAPAGDEAQIAGALDVEYRLSDAEHTILVKEGTVNGVRAIAGAGIIIDASRTLSTDTRWLYVNVRLLFNFVKSSLKNGLRWVRQEPNRNTLWTVIKYSVVSPFLLGLWQQGAFGTGTPDEVFTIICDASNNPPTEVDQGNLNIEVYFYPSKPAETIIIKVGQQPSGGFTREA